MEKKLVPTSLNELMSTIPTEVGGKNVDKEILRTAIISELDAINLYEQFAEKTTNKKLKVLLLDIAKEEKTHVGEFQAFLLEIDKEQVDELKAGKKEVEEQ
jgi:rubrerythrin